MDVTPLFKACVKSVRTRNKAFGVGEAAADKSRILRNRPKNAFLARAKDVSAQITKVRDLLLSHRSAYLNFSAFMRHADTSAMSDAERDKLDSGSQRIVNACCHIVADFKRDTDLNSEFKQAVVNILEMYLKAVCRIQAEQKTLRAKRTFDYRKLSRLEPDKERTAQVAAEMDAHASTDDDRLSSEEMQMFESENLQLYGELNSLSEEVKQIERKVLHIAELQEVFTEKVLQQDQDVDRIAGTVMGVNENVRDANEQIKQAIQRNAGLRVWVLFFLLVMSFSLLFLDWYND